MKPTEAAWLAGMIDADGCVTLNKQTGPWRKPLMVVDSTDPEILLECQRLAGGSIVKKKQYQEHHRPAQSWRLYGASQIMDVLREILPYMKCPSKVLRATMLVEHWTALTPKNGYYTEELLKQKRQLQADFMAVGHGRGSSSRV
jgi:hypothetical protein